MDEETIKSELMELKAKLRIQEQKTQALIDMLVDEGVISRAELDAAADRDADGKNE
ncbi:hypothetical protein KY362_07095 [Candidatus Woesearchaeota archaeon]|nr:hypothetical protein [Candidatus Woesearchaeota archaeon]